MQLPRDPAINTMLPNTMVPNTKPRGLALFAAGFGFVLMAGCASSPVSKVASTTQVEYYPACYEPVQHLRQTDADVQKSVLGGAAVGALGGALAGALVGNSEDRARNVAIGVAGGALVGGAAGYYTEKQKQIADDNQRIGSYAADIDKSAANIDRSVGYAKASQSCYQSAFTQLVDGRKAKTIDDTEGRKRLAEIVAGLKESNDLITAAHGRAGENLDSYTQAYERDLQTVGVKRADVATVAAADTVTTTTQPRKKKTPAKKKLPTVPQEAVSTEKTLQRAKTKQALSQEVAATGQSQVNAMCKSPDLGDWAPVPCPNV